MAFGLLGRFPKLRVGFIGMVTRNWYAASAMAGKAPSNTKAELRAICSFPHDDRFAIMVRRDTGTASVYDIVERRFPRTNQQSDDVAR
ncbi:MAG: hypothetical protein GEU73_00860 [Chloroflexi bacterium]|nr:hypothetical protein [Chloroflexota bacterium]